MKYIDGFRNTGTALQLQAAISRLGAALAAAGRRANVMEVCGSHTMAIARFGIRDLLPSNIDLISGPGCPVCVTDAGYIDAAIELARKGAVVATFGDMISVPGSDASLAECRAQGGAIEVCYSPTSALDLAAEDPGREIVFLAIGFESTIGPGISIVDTAIRNGIENLSILTAFKLVPPALRALMADPEIRIDAFLCPAHVSAVIGSDAYAPFAGPAGVPCVIAGFEPLDILLGLQGILEQLIHGTAVVENQYSRVVKPRGNPRIQSLIAQYLQPEDVRWRGLGLLPQSGMVLRAAYAHYDAAQRHGIDVQPGRDNPGCLCGEVIKGKHRPSECPLFGRACTPEHPVGPCMVSAEGSCAASYKYSRAA